MEGKMDEAQLIAKKSDEIIGVYMGLMATSTELPPYDFALFCALVPDGEELWKAFTSRRDAPDAPDGYHFVTYAREIVAEFKAREGKATTTT
jgi:hypothetical protein